MTPEEYSKPECILHMLVCRIDPMCLSDLSNSAFMAPTVIERKNTLLNILLQARSNCGILNQLKYAAVFEILVNTLL